MKHNIYFLAGLLFFTACASKEQIRQVISENPEIVYEAIRKDPVTFMKVAQEAAQSSQEQYYRQAQKQRTEQLEKDLKKPREAHVDPSRLLFGEKSASVTIIKYADFQCPACRMGFQSLEEIKKKYGAKVSVIHKNIPLQQHEQARLSAQVFEALLILNRTQAQKFYRLAYETQGQWNSEKQVWDMLKKVGGAKDKVMAEIKKGVVDQRIAEDLKEHRKLGFEGTPAYMINGVALYGAPDPETLSSVIDRVLK